jgi:hypothetical protein
LKLATWFRDRLDAERLRYRLFGRNGISISLRSGTSYWIALDPEPLPAEPLAADIRCAVAAEAKLIPRLIATPLRRRRAFSLFNALVARGSCRRRAQTAVDISQPHFGRFV